jgi:hypothetical protein
MLGTTGQTIYRWHRTFSGRRITEAQTHRPKNARDALASRRREPMVPTSGALAAPSRGSRSARRRSHAASGPAMPARASGPHHRHLAFAAAAGATRRASTTQPGGARGSTGRSSPHPTECAGTVCCARRNPVASASSISRLTPPASPDPAVLLCPVRIPLRSVNGSPPVPPFVKALRYVSPRARRLTAAEEAAIKALAGTRSLRSLAADFGVSHEKIRAILRSSRGSA